MRESLLCETVPAPPADVDFSAVEQAGPEDIIVGDANGGWRVNDAIMAARAMEGLMSPESPLPYVKETSFVYASGWPQSFIGDLHYYVADYDLTDRAAEIDTGQVGVHILSGEYDHSGTSELGKAAHEAIAGSTWCDMKNVGHFPMSENPEEFINYLLPVLQQIRAANR